MVIYSSLLKLKTKNNQGKTLMLDSVKTAENSILKTKLAASSWREENYINNYNELAVTLNQPETTDTSSSSSDYSMMV